MGITENASNFLLPLLLLSIFLTATDSMTIESAQYIRDGEKMISKGGFFELGFFSPGDSKNRYVGIWYGNQPVQTVVWVANRENPVTDSSGVFKIGSDGNLMVLDGKERAYWSSNASLSSNKAIGELLDTGNLVLRDRYSPDPASFLWQSFDHPSDTFLPTMKFWLDIRTGETQLLKSWKSANDPSPGNFSIGFDTEKVAQLVTWDSNGRYWRSGQWNGQSLTGIPDMSSFFLYGFNVVTDEEEGKVYCIYSNVNQSMLSRFTLSSSGQIQRAYWVQNRWEVVWSRPDSECEFYNKCGPNGSCDRTRKPLCNCMPGFEPASPQRWSSGNWSGGCVRRTELDCKNGSGRGDGYMKLPGMKLPDRSHRAAVLIENEGDCKFHCTKNCSCIAFAYDSGLGCLLWGGDLKDTQKFPIGGQVLHLRLAFADLGETKQEFTFIILMIVLAAVMLALYTLYLWWWISKERGMRRSEVNRGMHLLEMGSASHKESNRQFLDENKLEGVSQEKGPELPLFGLDTVRAATNDFCETNKLGQGGFGPVYKGKLKNGKEIAVKRLLSGSGQGMVEFVNEVILISKLQHRNLVRLLGYCIQGEEKMLLYEYMPNRSLDAFLFDPIKRLLLDWNQRFYIIEGIARGLLYLHRDSRLRIIHRDLKASNILLDREMNPKISDFGMAKIFGGNQNQANTVRVVGTYGYMAPEYAMEGLFSVKSDVFSFGVLLLEIVSGKRNTSFHHPGQPLNLLGYAWKLWNEEKMMELIDPSMDKSCSASEVSRCIQVGLLCVQDCTTDRPTMDSVVFMLGNEAARLSMPKEPAFSRGRTPRESDLYGKSSEICSVNDLTLSTVSGR